MSTIRDVARVAGVSVGTVSNYFNGAKIKEASRLNIEKAVEQMDFRLNPMARGLKKNKSGTVGILIQDLADVFEATYVKVIEKRLFERGYNLMICDTSMDEEVERKQVELLLSKRVDGFIISPVSDRMPFMERLQKAEVPCVLIDTGTRQFDCDQVLIDNDNAVYDATELLINHRHHRIGLITGKKEVYTARERLRGYQRALDSYHLDSEEQLVQMAGWDEASGYRAMNALFDLPEPPTAILAANYYTTVGMLKAVFAREVRVPEDLSLIGFDDIGFTDLVRPPLTVVSQPMEELGNLAAELLVRRINGDYGDFPSILRLKTELHIKKSVTRPL